MRGFDRTFEFIFSESRSKQEQQAITDFYHDMISTYGEIKYATGRGLSGIPARQFIAVLGGAQAVEPADFWTGVPRTKAEESS